MVYFELSLVLALIALNGFLAMSELAVVSSRRARLQAMAAKGSRGADKALALAGDPGRFLSTVQIGITLVGILSGAFSGATLGDRLAGQLEQAGLPSGAASALGVGAVVAVITYLSLIFGELVPKQLALRNPERLAARVAPGLSAVSRIAAPAVWLLDVSGRTILTLLGQGGRKEQTVTEEEVRMLLTEAESSGAIEPDERRMIAGVMRLADRPVRSVMTPRHDVDMIDLSKSDAENRDRLRESVRSRLPAHDGDPAETSGIVWVKDLLDRPEAPLLDLVRDAPILPESLGALQAIEMLRRSPVHVGLVHDEYGHFVGMVTAADMLESITGAFAADDGASEDAMVRRDDGSWLVAGWMPADELAEALALDLPERRSYATSAGLVIEALERLPALGESVVIGNWRFEVVDMDGRRVDKLLAARAG